VLHDLLDWRALRVVDRDRADLLSERGLSAVADGPGTSATVNTRARAETGVTLPRCDGT
jgi:hypothetical protein